MPFLTAPLEPTHEQVYASTSTGKQGIADDLDAAASQWVRDTIVLCPTAANEWLPMHPDYPADIFTSCLTTPIQMALRWFVRRNPQAMKELNPDDVDLVPGKANDRKTPLGELNWIFTAVTDSIAWNVLPKPLFQRLFRQDLLVASMFRNFLLADRILRSLNCSPQSYPPLPPGVSEHPLWQAWDLACETCLTGLMKDGIIGNLRTIPPIVDGDGGENQTTLQTTEEPMPATGLASSISSPFFSEQLTAFEIWLEFASIHKKAPHHVQDPNESPEELPVVLQVLLSQAHRVRALKLLRQFLDLGPWAVNLALSLGIYPYVMKLLQSPEYKLNLVGIWAKILAFDPTCQVDLVKDGALPHFIHHLTWGLNKGTLNQVIDSQEAAEQRTMAAFILAVTCSGYSQGQAECMRLNLHGTCCALLSSMDFGESGESDPDFLAKMTVAEQRTPAKFRAWLCLCLGSLMKDNAIVQNEAFEARVHLSLIARMDNEGSPDVRAAASYSLGCMFGSLPIASSEIQEDSTLVPTTPQLSHQSSFQVGSGGLIQPQLTPNSMVGTPQQTMTVSLQGAPSSGFSGRLQPSFGPNSGYGAPWNSQQVSTGTLQGAMGGHVPLALQVHSIPYNQSSPTAQPPGLGPPILLMGVGSNGHTENHAELFANQLLPMSSPPHRKLTDSQRNVPSVFDDRSRLRLDLELMDALVRATRSASPLVRFEAAVSLASAVEKYLPAFLAVSDEIAMTSYRSEEQSELGLSTQVSENTCTSRGGIDCPRGLDRETFDKFGVAWKVIKDMQQRDPHFKVASAANSIVSYVHENILVLKMQTDPTSLHSRGNQAEKGAQTDDQSFSEHIRKRVASSGMLSKSATNSLADDVSRRRVVSDAKDIHSPTMRRTASELGGSMLSKRGLRAASVGSSAGFSSASDVRRTMEYELPKSELFAWKRDAFVLIDDDDTAGDQGYDPLSSRGATLAYQARRNKKVHTQSEKLADYYVSLLPKPREKASFNTASLLESDEEKELLAEEELSAKKNTLRLKQTKVFKNDAQEMTSILKFHPYEDVLVVCSGQDKVSLWNTDSGCQNYSFSNGNPKGSRMTSSCWINSTSKSLFALGCDDGSVRIWSDLAGKQDGNVPNLTSAFCALPHVMPDTRGSGMILEWQQYAGRLLAGGTSNSIQCWDLGAERWLQALPTQTEACVTTISTAWNEILSDSTKFVGIGPDVIIAGFSDGAIRTFDLRTQRSTGSVSGTRGQRSQAQHYKEHESWIVSTAFTGYGGNHEVSEKCANVLLAATLTHIILNVPTQIVSGSISGEIKIWDLRFSESLRTHNVQRSPMTALAVHQSIPFVATGSHAQFIKVFSLDGDTLEVIRYHEEMAGHRIGPVGCLVFHPHKLLLASGGTDAIVGLYGPKNSFTAATKAKTKI
jgi:WD40 repeat protein